MQPGAPSVPVVRVGAPQSNISPIIGVADSSSSRSLPINKDQAVTPVADEGERLNEGSVALTPLPPVSRIPETPMYLLPATPPSTPPPARIDQEGFVLELVACGNSTDLCEGPDFFRFVPLGPDQVSVPVQEAELLCSTEPDNWMIY